MKNIIYIVLLAILLPMLYCPTAEATLTPHWTLLKLFPEELPMLDVGDQEVISRPSYSNGETTLYFFISVNHGRILEKEIGQFTITNELFEIIGKVKHADHYLQNNGWEKYKGENLKKPNNIIEISFGRKGVVLRYRIGRATIEQKISYESRGFFNQLWDAVNNFSKKP